MTEPDKRTALALATLEDAEAELRQAVGCGLDFPASSFIAKALTAVLQARAHLQRELF